MLLALLLGFVLGALAVVAAEASFLLLFLNRLSGRKRPLLAEDKHPAARDFDGEQSLPFLLNKQGTVWVLEPEKIPKVVVNEPLTRGTKEQKKKDILEVSPVKKTAKIKDHSLILSDSDGSQVTIGLLDCTIVAVSASDLSSRKWAKRYPIKLESKNSEIYKGSKICYIYLDTSWEKESWCKALRLASCPDYKRLKWYLQLTEDFQLYLTSLNTEYPSFLKPSALLGEFSEKTNKIDGSSSRVRHFLKRLAKKSSKYGTEYKANLASSSTRGERYMDIRSNSLNELASTNGSVKALSDKSSNSSLQDLVQIVLGSSIPLGNKSQIPVFSDAIIEEKFIGDDGTLCWNLLFSRLFFDAKRNDEINSFIKARIQRGLSSTRTPSYIGDVTCSGFNIGNLPPYIHSIKVIPVDLNDVWAVEVDLEYLGGMVLDIETRLEVGALELQKDIMDTNSEQSSSGEVTSDLLEGIEYYGNQLKHCGTTNDRMESRDDGDKMDGLKQSKSMSWKASYVSRWKAIIHSIADQVSQVPLSLALKISSLRGTLRLHIKPPPSDHLWFAFTSMPEISLKLESAIGDRKITSSHIALLITNRVKAVIRETIVLPNCESICIPWMLAEKDDWVSRSVAPFIWSTQDCNTSEAEAVNPEPEEVKDKPDCSNKTSLDAEVEKVKNLIHDQEQPDVALSEPSTSQAGQTLDNLRVPLLRDDKPQENNHGEVDSNELSSAGSLALEEEQKAVYPEEMKPKKTGSRRARMMDLGKKMGEKFEEKRRHLEEKGRHIVEKMRENTRHDASQNNSHM